MGERVIMNWTAVRKVVTVTSTGAALVLISLVVIKYGIRTSSAPDIRSAPITLEAKPSAKAAFSFTPLEDPRPLPELRFVDGEGRRLTIADFRGRLVLLNIWATWCGPCRREMPTLDRLQAKIGGPDFEVVALSIDRQGVPVVKEFYRELGLKALGIYVDKSSQVTRDLNILGIPTTLLIDQRGREIGRVVGPAEWDGPEVVKLVRRYLNPASLGSDASKNVLKRENMSPTSGDTKAANDQPQENDE